jgi:hypothetical protein
MKRSFSFALFLVLIVIFSCEKERSLENSKLSNSSSGSLQSSAGECLPKLVAGAYVSGVAVGATNFMEVDVNVDQIGSYFITTDTINGYYFSASGDFPNTGANTIKLTAKGKPLAAGGDIFTVSFDSSSCTVDVTVLSASAGTPAVFSLQTSGTNCMDAAVTGSYTKAVALNSTNKVDIKVNVTTIGSYSVSTTATNGMTFSGSGAFSTTGVQSITLTGSGTPVTDGSIVIPVAVGTSACSFTVMVNASTTNPPPTSTYKWKFTSAGATHQGTVDDDGVLEVIAVTPTVNITAISFFGSNTAGDTSIALAIADLNNVINANETYVSTSTSSNSAAIEIDYAGTLYTADPQTTGATVTITVTSHNATTKLLAGTFSGTLKNPTNGQLITITNGQFNIHYQ